MMHSGCLRGLVLVAVLGLVGCSSPAPRPLARLGDAPDMVQRTMGRPDERRAGPNVGSEQIVWVFRNYSQQTAPREKTGWSEVLSPGIRDQRGNAVQKPVTRDIYYTPVGADIQVTFTDGVVSSVERLKK